MKEANSPGPPNILFLERKKARYQLRSAQRIKSAIDWEKFHDDIMVAHENNDVMFNKQIKSQRKQPNQEVNELIHDGESYTDN